MSATDPATPVTIFGKVYPLRGDGDPVYLHELAREVDLRMKEVAEMTGTADTLKVAILAALNIADECLQARRGVVSPETARQWGRWVALIDETLDDPGCRPHETGYGSADASA